MEGLNTYANVSFLFFYIHFSAVNSGEGELLRKPRLFMQIKIRHSKSTYSTDLGYAVGQPGVCRGSACNHKYLVA